MIRLGALGAILTLALVAIGTIAGANAASAQSSQPEPASLTVHFRVCPEIPAGNDYYASCHDNGSGANGHIDIFNADFSAVVTSGTTDASGNVTFFLNDGTYNVWGPPGDFLDATATFCSDNDSPSVALAYPVALEAGDAVTCDFYVVPSCNAADGDCTPDTTPPADDDDDDSGSGQVSTLPNTGAGAGADSVAAGWHAPLAALLAMLTLGALVTSRQARRRQ